MTPAEQEASDLSSEEREQAQLRIDAMAGILDEALSIMAECPFPDELSRVSSAMMIFSKFEPAHHALMAAVAVERMSRPSPISLNSVTSLEDL